MSTRKPVQGLKARLVALLTLSLTTQGGWLTSAAWAESLRVSTGDLDCCEFGEHIARLTAEEDDRFGRTVDISGDRIIVGAPYDDDLGENSGAAYVFRNDGLGWILEVKLTAAGDYDCPHPCEPVGSR